MTRCSGSKSCSSLLNLSLHHERLSDALDSGEIVETLEHGTRDFRARANHNQAVVRGAAMLKEVHTEAQFRQANGPAPNWRDRQKDGKNLGHGCRMQPSQRRLDPTAWGTRRPPPTPDDAASGVRTTDSRGHVVRQTDLAVPVAPSRCASGSWLHASTHRRSARSASLGQRERQAQRAGPSSQVFVPPAHAVW